MKANRYEICHVLVHSTMYIIYNVNNVVKKLMGIYMYMYIYMYVSTGIMDNAFDI